MWLYRTSRGAEAATWETQVSKHVKTSSGAPQTPPAPPPGCHLFYSSQWISHHFVSVASGIFNTQLFQTSSVYVGLSFILTLKLDEREMCNTLLKFKTWKRSWNRAFSPNLENGVRTSGQVWSVSSEKSCVKKQKQLRKKQIEWNTFTPSPVHQEPLKKRWVHLPSS